MDNQRRCLIVAPKSFAMPRKTPKNRKPLDFAYPKYTTFHRRSLHSRHCRGNMGFELRPKTALLPEILWTKNFYFLPRIEITINNPLLFFRSPSATKVNRKFEGKAHNPKTNQRWTQGKPKMKILEFFTRVY